MTETQPGPVTAYLAGARERMESADLAFQSGGSFAEAAARSQSDVPHLLAAVEKVLELAAEWKATSVQLGEMAERADARGADPLRTTLMDARAQAHQDNAQALREAITSGLLGEGE